MACSENRLQTGEHNRDMQNWLEADLWCLWHAWQIWPPFLAAGGASGSLDL